MSRIIKSTFLHIFNQVHKMTKGHGQADLDILTRATPIGSQSLASVARSLILSESVVENESMVESESEKANHLPTFTF